MRPMKNLMEKIELQREKINPYYDMTVPQMNEIFTCSDSAFEIIINAFTFGYMQGQKASKKEKIN